MSDTQRPGDQIRKQGHTGMRLEELLPHRKQLRVKNPLYSRQVNLSVLDVRMVPVRNQGRSRKEQKINGRLVLLKSDFVHLSLEPGTFQSSHFLREVLALKWKPELEKVGSKLTR